MKKILGTGVILFCVFHGTAQELSRSLEEVQVAGRAQHTGIQKLSKAEIQVLQPDDAGQLLQKFAGVTLKNYGGLGGMKTISVRGIGGTHTGIVVDGFLIQNSQTGQIDLSNVQVENTENISLSIGGADGYLLPVSAHLSGSVLSIRTFENSFSAEKTQVRATLRGGSFGQLDSYLSLKFGRPRFFASVFGKYRRADGKYPFEFENAQQTYRGDRFNNDLQEGFGGLSFGFRTSGKTILKISYQANASDRGLPGAVILYNPTADQRLTNQSHQVNADFRYISRRTGIRGYASTRYEDLKYVDSSFLNVKGFLDQRYYNASVQQGISFQSEITDSLAKTRASLYGGIEQNYSELHSSIPGFAQPSRYHLKSVAGTEIARNSWSAVFQLGGEAVFDQNRIAPAARTKYVLTPYLLLQSCRVSEWWGTPRIWVKRTFRMPSFNELYYNQIGNVSLKPEIANQADIGTEYARTIRRHFFQLRLDAYYNLVQNKIVAIPTKNLFVWSMQNVGLAQVIGTDVQLSHSRDFSDIWLVSTRLTYTFQHVTDISDRTSATYGDQLPYLPRHTGNADITVTRKKTGAGLSALAVSERYALNENIVANRVNGFLVVDGSVFHTFEFRSSQQLRISFSVKNIFNASYAFVRYYVMPGTHFIFSLNYAFH